MTFPAVTHRIFYIDITKIKPSPRQPRKDYDPSQLAKLAYSIKMHGVIQPVTLRRKNGVFELVAGERRVRAARMAGLTKVPAIIRKMGDETAACVALAENMQRQPLSYFEQAGCCRDYINRYNISTRNLAKTAGKTDREICGRLESLLLPEPVRTALAKNGFEGEYNDAFFIVKNEELQCRLAEEIVQRHLSPVQAIEFATGLVVRPETHPVRKSVVGDMKIYLNTLMRSVGMIDKLGGNVETFIKGEDGYTEYRIRIKNTMLK